MRRFISWIRRRKKQEEVDYKVFSCTQLAEGLQMFPSVVEKTLKELEERGIIECRIYQGEVYAIIPKDFDLEKALSKKDDPMIR